MRAMREACRVGRYSARQEMGVLQRAGGKRVRIVLPCNVCFRCVLTLYISPKLLYFPSSGGSGGWRNRSSEGKSYSCTGN